MTLAMNHARLLFVETIRVPVAVLFNLVFPALLLLLFVVPVGSIAGNPLIATAAAAQLTVFAVMNTFLLNFGIGVSEERSRAWDPYVRTLPAGPVPRMFGRLLNGLMFAVLSMIPVLLISAFLTEATATPAQLGLGALAVLGGTLPFLFGGFAIGYTFPVKAALPVAQLALLPMALVGGLFIPPTNFPGWLNNVSQVLPTRGARDLTNWVVTGQPASTLTLIALTGWISLTAFLAVFAYQRDEGRRFS